MFSVEWTGSYPNYCVGEWIIKYNGQLLELPKRSNKHMNTYGEYRTWYWGDNGIEVWEEYSDGLGEDEWIIDNLNWLIPLFDRYSIPKTRENYQDLYKKIQDQDFRTNSCGGCI